MRAVSDSKSITWWIRRQRRGQRGQTVILVVLAVGLVLLAIVGFAVDFGNLWFKRQAAQTAADATCTAAVMDMLWNTQGGGSAGGFTTGTPFNCSSGTGGAPTSAPCKYAALNGYNGAGLVADTESNSVEVTFPSSISGNPVPI